MDRQDVVVALAAVLVFVAGTLAFDPVSGAALALFLGFVFGAFVRGLDMRWT
ncbi:hypothetical protein [Halosegnis longus]|uniref:hypothetical protein n=1 Tax=Halosegnis longus TaxID=2216012 RepID=UPI00129D7F28|nr:MULTISPECIES: hypothetical protein [Halobacteriales]